uniref:Enhancer of mRNA-decapping protein 4 C-terminal domain-containing protein n=1 Tax=Odontella aurita TaxID=265563 RepID=A0A7S4K9R6_9STRA|mmetsp:Transcript_7674/g.22531  ORF Transcript_7674/g.22531 Transcript_7674/m.22531 type:complete len:1260 (+) Transcript_7674:211-3990(+)
MTGVPLPAAYKTVYDASSSSSLWGGQPRTTPIAHFASLPPAHPNGSLLDANSSYIVYAVKGGLVRVIDRRGALRTLLRGHSQRVTDVSFCGNVPGGSNFDAFPKAVGGAADGGSAAPPPPQPGSDILATVGGEGDRANVLIWRIIRRDGELAAEKLLEMRFRPAVRVIWHPFNPNQILLLHRPGAGGGNVNGEKKCAASATLVDTMRLSTVVHKEGGHQVCLCGAAARGGGAETAENDGAGGDAIEGTVRLVVPGSGAADANDLCWSPVDARYVLTAHGDGFVRLWDLRGRAYVDSASGEEVPSGSAGLGAGGAAPEGVVVSASIAGKVAVCDASSEVGCESGADRCQFLPKFADASSDGASSGKDALTPPFLTGHKNNSTVTLWSPFLADGSAPTKVAVFELSAPSPLRLSLALCDDGNTLRPSQPSAFAFLADSEGGGLFALHLRSSSGGGKPVATGFDYLIPFRLTHPIYSWTVGTIAAGADDDAQGLVEEGDVDVNLFAVQSRAVQMFSIFPGMRGGPSGGDRPPGMLAEGVTVEGRPEEVTAAAAAAVVTNEEGANAVAVEYDDYDHDDEDMQEDEDDEEEDEDDEDVDVGHGPPASSLPPPGLSPDLKPIGAAGITAAPPGVGSGEGAFANWLGNLAAAAPAPAAAPSPKGAPRPPPPSTPANTPATAYKPLVPRAPPPGMSAPPGMPGPPPGMGVPTPPPPPIPVQLKTAAGKANTPTDEEDGGVGDDPRELVTRNDSGFLSPMEILQSAASASAAKKKEKEKEMGGKGAGSRTASRAKGKKGKDAAAASAGIDLDKAVGALPVNTSVPSAKKEPTPKRSGRSSRPRGAAAAGGESKSPSRPKSGDGGVGKSKKSKTPLKGGMGMPVAPIPGGDGKITLLRREEKPLGDAAGALPIPPAAPLAAAAAPAISSAEVEEAVRKSMSSHFRTHQTLLLAEVQKAVKSEVESAVVPAIDSAVVGSMDKCVTKPLGATIQKSTRDAYKVRTKEVVEGVSAEVGGKVVEAFHKSMREVMIPAYESATRQVFSQVSSAVQSGLAAQTQQRSAHEAEMMQLMRAMSSKMDTMSSTIEVLTAEVTKLKAAGTGAADAAASAAAADAARQQAEAANRSRAMRDEILGLLRSRDYEAAFTKALSASDGEIAVFACRNADLSDALEGSSPKLSQPILLCLMQQLGAVLASTASESDLRVELAWLQDIAVTLDPADEAIGRHVGGVLRQLVANVNAKMAQEGLDHTLRRPLQMLLQVIRGMGVVS